MPSFRAASSAFFLSREAIAVISLCAPFCIPGITLRTAMEAAPRIPHFTFFITLLRLSPRGLGALSFVLSASNPSTLPFYTASARVGEWSTMYPIRPGGIYDRRSSGSLLGSRQIQVAGAHSERRGGNPPLL